MQRTNLNISPIFDDFDESKNYHRVLFNAGKSVQARELTQAQTILQSQIERMGRHLFTEGAMVVPGGIRAIESQYYVKLTLNSGSNYSDFSGEDSLFIKSNANGAIFKVAKKFDVSGADPVTLFVDFLTPGTGQQKSFSINEQITLFVYNSNGTIRNVALGMITGAGNGQWVKVQSGVYFVRGMFVRASEQDYIVSKYQTNNTIKVGFRVSESIVSSAQDDSLYSNAVGFPNQNSDGASRLKVTLSLTGLNIGVTDPDFIELARFEDGKLQSKVDTTQYSIIDDALARRTYETNGDYVVEKFGLSLKEHLLSGNNGGVFASVDGGDESKLVALIKPGTGYVKGYRVNNIGIQKVPFNKARDTAFLNNISTGADYGQYFLVTSLLSLPEIDIKKKILLLDSSNVQIGTARVRAIRKDGSNYRVYVFDIAFNADKYVTNVAKIKYTDASNLVTANLVSSVLYDSSRSAFLFRLPVGAVKTLYTPGVGGDTSYSVSRSFNLVTNSSGITTASTGSNETFGLLDSSTYFVALTGAATPGTQFDPMTTITIGGTIVGTTLTINLGASQANKTIRLIAPVIKNQTTQKTKTLTTVTNEIISFPDTNRQKLSKADIYDLISVTDNTTGEVLTNQFYIDNGQKDAWYESGKLVRKDSTPITRTVKVTYRYFVHSAGDYFSIDSYVGMDREAIPSYGSTLLADCIDFRPLKDSAGDFTSVTVSGEPIKPNDSLRADITYYLPRKDIVVAYSDGSFGVVSGISGVNPSLPETPSNAMRLYELTIPAYTYDPNDIIVKEVDNKRYTMRDIGKLENRIANVEYYTTLSALESKTNKTQVIDPVTGNNRFRNGFAVDGFNDYRMADIEHPEWSASMDLTNNKLMTSFVENAVGFTNSSITNAVKPTSVFLKSYSDVSVVDQPYATTTVNINPYGVFTWVGDVSLTPDRDFWRDVRYNQPVVINNTVNLRGNAVQGTVWNSWSVTREAQEFWTAVWNGDEILSDTVIANLTVRDTTTTGTTTTFNQSTSSNTTDTLVNTEILYYMRSIDVQFQCSGFRPHTRLYAFFDGISVDAECKQTGKNYGDPIITDASGAASGVFTVPNRADKRFLTGTSVLRFTDSSTDSRDPNVMTTSGSTTFMSQGVQDNRLLTTTNTTVLSFSTTSTTTTSSETISRRPVNRDPIAQTFTIPNDGGAYITKIDVFFSTKDANIPVTLELRTVVAGVPSSDVVGKVTLKPIQVNTSADGTAATTFTFADPIYLEQYVEYAIVLMADTQSYNVYVAEQGQNVIGANMALSRAAHLGVFLTSSNSTTWTPHQYRDMKFKVYRASFSTASSSIVWDCTDPETVPLSLNPITTTTGSNIVSMRYPSHGLKVGDSATISGAVAGNNITAAAINKTVVVTAVTVDTFSFVATTNANATGTIGGDAVMCKANYPFNRLINNVAAYIPSGCDVVWEYNITGQTNRVKSGWTAFVPLRDTRLTAVEGVVRSAGDLQIRATMTNDRDNLSPSIESSGFNAVLVSHRVDSADSIFNYVSTDIRFDNPTSHARFLIGAKLPGSSGMKVYVKEIDTADQEVSDDAWVLLAPTNPIANSESYVEYEYLLDGNFIGYKIKVELKGSNINPPSLLDIRTLAFA